LHHNLPAIPDGVARFVVTPDIVWVPNYSGLAVVIDEVSDFVLQPAIAAATEQPFLQHWRPQNRGQTVSG
jgi:hypothetical protein